MNELFEPNVHPFFVHFGYALTIVAAGLFVMARFGPDAKRERFANAANVIVFIAGVSLLATIAAGLWAYYTVAHDGPSHEAMTIHRNWALPSAVGVIALAVWRWMTRKSEPNSLFVGLLASGALALTIAGWWGSHIVYNYGIGVKSLPSVSGDGHDHDHGDVAAVSDTEHDGEMTITPSPAAIVPAGHDNSDGHHGTSAMPVSPNAPMTALQHPAENIVNEFHAAMRRGDSQAMGRLMADDVIIAEGGGSERGFAEYASHHMGSDIAFMAATNTTLMSRDTIISETQVTVFSESEIRGHYKGKEINLAMTESMVLGMTQDSWRIAHVHWSSSPIQAEISH